MLPAGFPNLLVNGTAGIAVGMATNMAPHNLGEVIAAARHLIANPDATLDELMRFVPGPDLPTGGKIIGLDGSGRPTRPAAARSGPGPPPRSSSHPPAQRHRGHRAPLRGRSREGEGRIKDLVQAKKLQGIAELTDLTDGKRGLRLVIEIRSGFIPEAVLEELYRLTPMEDTFGINNVALVDGQPRRARPARPAADLHRPPDRRRQAGAPSSGGPSAATGCTWSTA